MKKDNVRRASNEAFFATMDGRTSWKVVKDTNTSTQVILEGDSASMLAGLVEKKPKFTDMGVTVLGKVIDTGLVIDITDGVKEAAE